MRLTLIKSLQYCSVCHVCVCLGSDVRQEVSERMVRVTQVVIERKRTRVRPMMVKPGP